MAPNRAQQRAQALRRLAAQQQSRPSGLGVRLSPVTVERVREQERAEREQAEKVAGTSRERMVRAAEARRKKMGGGDEDDGGGMGGIFGKVLGNPIAQAVLKPLEVLDAPRRYITSGINELADAVNGGDASWGDFLEQGADTSFGFGDVVGETGIKWLDRGIGFLGDVALDPLTYVTLGSSAFAGSAGRAALAGQAAAKGLGEEAVSRAGRIGQAALSKAEREALDLGPAGLRFGTASRNVRIPGTGGLATSLGRGVAATRGVATDTGLGRAARRLGGSRSPELRPFVERLTTGKGPMSATAAANTYAGLRESEALGGMFIGEFSRDVRRTGRDLQGRGDITRAVEAGVKNPETERVAGLFDRMFQSASKSVKGLKHRQRYVPHLQTEEFRKFLDDSGEEGRALITSQPGQATGRVEARQFEPGKTYTINGVDVKLDTATLDDIESKFQDAFPELRGVKLMEDDPALLLARALEDYSRDVGRAGLENRLLAGGSIRELSDRSVLRQVPDVEANRDLAERVRAGAQPLRAKRKGVKREVNRRGAEAVALARAPEEALLARANALKAIADDRLAGVGALEAGSVADRGAIDAGLSAAMQAGRGQLDRLDNELARLDQQIAVLAPLAEADEAAALGLRMAQERRTELEGMVRAGRAASARRGRITRQLNTPASAEELAELDAAAARGASFVAGPGGIETPRPVELPGQVDRRGLVNEYEALGGPVEAGRQAAAELPDVTPERVTEQLRQPVRDQLENTEDAWLETAVHRDVVEERMRNIPQQARRDIEAWESVKRAIAGQADATLDDAVRIDELVENAKARVAATKLPAPVKRNVVEEYDRYTREVRDAIGSGAPPEAVRLLESARMLMPEIEKINAKLITSEKLHNDLRSGKLVKITKDVLADGYAAFKSKTLGRDDLAIDRDVKRALTNVTKAMESNPTAFARIVDSYTQVFKSYATATPGFHLRNAFSASYMNLSDGVSFQNMGAGVRIWRAWERNPQGKWWADLPPRYRDVAQDVIRGVYGTGAGGQFSAQEVGSLAHRRGRARNQLANNLVLRGSKWTGEQVEGAVRAGMVLDTLLGSGAKRRGSVPEAIARTNRIHLNYGEISEFDAQARRLIPFWTWMSRNVPLQVVQMWTKPRTYAHYESLKRNLESEQGSSDLPEYMRDAGGFRVSDSLALMPDIGSNQLQNTIEQMTSARGLGALTPAVQVPLSLGTNRDFFYDAEYQDNDFQKPGWELAPLMPVFQALGLTETAGNGQQVLERKHADAARDLLPFLGQLNRIGATTSDREGRELQGALNFAGIPVKQLTDQVMEAEQRRRRGSAYYENLENQARLAALARFRE